MSFLTIDLTTKALIRALQWRSMEAEDKSSAARVDQKTELNGPQK